MVVTPATEAMALPDGDVGLFIDWENFKYSLYETGQIPHVAALIQAVRERYGRPALARAYADWQDYYHRKSSDQMNLYAAGIEPVYVPSRRSPTHTDRIKNSVDVRMSLDCLEVSFTHRHLQTFVLVAGDADFQHVVGALRRRGARVVMIGVSGSTSQRLAAVVDDLLFYDTDIAIPSSASPPSKERLPASPASDLSLPPPPALPALDGNGVKPDESKVGEVEAAVQALVSLVRRQREEGGRNYPPLLSWLQMQLRDQPPFFVPQKHGFSQFKDFLHQMERQGLVTLESRDLTDRVWLAEDEAQIEGGSSRKAAPVPDESWAEDAQLAQQRDEFADVVLTADDIENSHREYMGRSLLARFLYNKGHWDPANLPSRAAPLHSSVWRSLEMPDIYRLLDVAAEKGLMARTIYIDPADNFEIAALELNRTHPFVRHVLSSVAW